MSEIEAEALGYAWGNAGAAFSLAGLPPTMHQAYKRGYGEGIADRGIGQRQIAHATQDPLCARCVELGDGTFYCVGTMDLACGQRQGIAA